MTLDQIPTLPEGFLWGFATAAFQIEGAVAEGGRGPSIWDTHTHTKGKILGGDTADVATDSYHRYKEDVALLKSLGCTSYRFSISWSRLIPLGGRNDPVNEEGIDYYNRLIDALLAEGIQPCVTIHHWDLPQGLFDRYNGWMNKEESALDFTNYSRLCFERFGDRVKHWITFNEPWCIAVLGHLVGTFAPGHHSKDEPWIVGHSLLVAHAHAVDLYRREFQPSQKGEIAITLNGAWFEPIDQQPENIQAAQDARDITFGWFADPAYFGDYPEVMKRILGDRLPSFTDEEKKLLKGSSDFFGLNAYTTQTCKAGGTEEHHAFVDMSFKWADGSEFGVKSEAGWLRDVPWGFGKLVTYLYNRYKKPIIITEFGFAVQGEASMPVEEAIHDAPRVTYYKGAIASTLEAVKAEGVVVRGIYPWSLLDNFEWHRGYRDRFGCVHVDFETQRRTPKDSAKWLSEFFGHAMRRA